MTRQDFARTCLAVVIGGFAAVAVTKSGISPQSATIRWLVYCIVAGVVLNSPTGMRLRDLATGSFLAALGFVVAVLWLAFLGEGVLPSFSGVKLDAFGRPGFFASVMSATLVVTTIGVGISAVARPATLNLLQAVGKLDVDKAKNIEAFLNVAVSICGVAAFFLL
jgi:hypothetical protein